MKESEEAYLNQWIEKAEHDLIAAKVLMQYQPEILDIAAFHCQQATEKYLKAFLIFKKEEFPRTHNLDLLLQYCSNHLIAFSLIDIKNMEDFAVRGRYPHDFLMPDQLEIQELYKIAV